jgi:multiple sugar transport system substrate-binding protein
VRRFCLAATIVVTGLGCARESATPEPEAPTRIRYLRWDRPGFAEADDEALAEYTRVHPGVEVDAVTARRGSCGGAQLYVDLMNDELDFDLMILDPSEVCTFADNLSGVPAEVATLAEAEQAFFGAPLAGSTCQGRLKGLPVEYSLEYGGVVVNLDKYQEKFPGRTPGWPDWATFLADAAALTEYEGEVVRANGLDLEPNWPQPAKHIFLSQILQRGGTYWAPGGDSFDFLSTAARAALQTMVDWVVRDRIMSFDLLAGENTFVTTRLARGASGHGWSDPARPLSVMGYAGGWALASTIGQVPAGSSWRFGFFSVPPMVGDQHRFVQNSGWALVVPRTSKNAARAWDIARSIALSPEGARRWAATAGTLPALRANGTREAAAGDPLLSAVQPLLEHGQWVGYIPAAAIETVDGAILRGFVGAATGKKSVDEALTEMQDAANSALRSHARSQAGPAVRCADDPAGPGGV